MARTIRVKLYQFNELSEDAQQKAIDKFRDLNVDFDWWDSVYDDFKMICDTVGIDVDLKKTYFSGFSSQGDGATFTASVDLLKLIDGINNKKYLEHAPNIHDEVRSFTPSPCTIDARVLDLIKREWIDVTVSVNARDRSYSSEHEFNSNYTHNECVNYDRIEKQLTDLESWIDDVVSEFDNLLYRLLEKEYEYRTSDEAVKEGIIANEYEFTKDGKQY